MKKTTPHDLFFARLLQDKELARSLFKAYFPDAVKTYSQLDTAELEHLNPKFVNEVLSSYRLCDVLYKATSTEGVLLLLAHIEHYSSPKEAIVLYAICYGLLAILDYHNNHPGERIPPILTLIYYNGSTPFPYSMDPLALFGDLPPELKERVLFKPQLIDLTQCSDQELATHGAFAPFETLLKHSHDKTDAQKIQLLDKTLRTVPSDFIVPALHYTLSCIETSQQEEFITMVSSHVGQEGFVSIADALRAEGIKQGMQEGRLQGMKQMQQAAKNLLASGLAIDFVAKNTGLDIELLKKLRDKA